ncbi:hypothetical protein GCM10007989_05790 [Devosia pacifica]|uniref:DUF418 domain-containing protein n=2 Tax=Devosia pacifica TaxID=1335967 RepID=A0A918RWG2_9HYPH|nr:hypothetical protein GCM10007989_05790 [Devosia pacifica]
MNMASTREDPSVVTDGRLEGLDAARALALVGMLCVHFGPEDAPGIIGAAYGVFHGRASILFAVVAGFGMALLAGSSLGIRAARYRLLSFAIVLLPLGLALQALDHGIAVILQHYALFFVLGALVLALPGLALIVSGALAGVLGPIAYLACRAAWPDLVDRGSVAWGNSPTGILLGLLLSGPYPLLTWAAPILVGIGAGKLAASGRGMAPSFVVGGLMLAALSIGAAHAFAEVWGAPTSDADWRNLLIVTAHSQMPLWIAQSTSIAVAVVGMMLLMGNRPTSVIRQAVARLALLGRYVLSVYVAHLLALALWRDALMQDRVADALLSVTGFSVAASICIWLWRKQGFTRGPVEMLVHIPWSITREILARRASKHRRPACLR